MQPGELGARWWCVAAGLLGLTVVCASSRAQTVLGTPQDMNDRIKALSSAARVLPHDYIIGNGDTLSVEVFDVLEAQHRKESSVSLSCFLPLSN